MVVFRCSSTVSLQGQKSFYLFIEEERECRLPFMRSAQSFIDMSLAKSVYHLLFRRTSTFAITIMVGAVFFERLFDQGGDAVFEQMNRGVSLPFAVKMLLLS